MANVPETQTRVAQLERKVELMEERLKKLEPDKKREPDREALDIVLYAAEVIARLWTGERAYDLKIAIAKLRGIK
jgi:hypothetical protein